MVASSDIEGTVDPAPPGAHGGGFQMPAAGTARFYALAAGGAALVAAGALSYVFRGQISGAAESAAGHVLWAAGLGVAPVGLWLAAFLAAAWMGRSPLSNLRPWAAALALVLASVVAMSAFTTSYGSPLDPLTNRGEVSLGGGLAERATLGSAWLAALEAAALTALAVAIISPALAKAGALRMGALGRRAWAVSYPAALGLLALGGAAAAALSVRAARGARGGGSALASNLARRPEGAGSRYGGAARPDPVPMAVGGSDHGPADRHLDAATGTAYTGGYAAATALASDSLGGRPGADAGYAGGFSEALASERRAAGPTIEDDLDDDGFPQTFAPEHLDDPAIDDGLDQVDADSITEGGLLAADPPQIHEPEHLDDDPSIEGGLLAANLPQTLELEHLDTDVPGDDGLPAADLPQTLELEHLGDDLPGDDGLSAADIPQTLELEHLDDGLPGANGSGFPEVLAPVLAGNGPLAPSAQEEGGPLGAGGAAGQSEAPALTEATAGAADPPAAPPAATNGVKVNRFWDGPAPAVAIPEQVPETETAPDPAEEAEIAEEAAAATPEVPILDGWASKWKLPDLSMLVDKPVKGITQEEMDETSVNIRDTLADYGVEVEVRMTQPGPAVTMYGLEPGWVRRYKLENATDDLGRPVLNEAGRPVRRRVETKTRVKVDTILQREKDLALALQTSSMRIESPIMGTSLVGIEVPNSRPELVTLRYVMKSPEFRELRKKAALPIALGKGSGGDTAVLDMARLPHLLVAGATGSGKSVCLNTIVSCLTMEKSPSELRMLLIDPKRVELTPYNGIPHLLTPVVVETDTVVPLLKALINEMFKRYRHLEQEGVRNIASYNAKATEKMPYLVLIVDELADLMMTSSMEVEQALCRLAQLGRATGIHLVIATQRPSVDVLTGLIKANFPSRIAFGVTSQIDSRTILDTAGADKLLGRGDMLYQPIDASRPARVQGVFISDEEVRELVDYWKTTRWAPLPEVGLEVAEEGDGDAGGASASTGDDLMDRAIELAIKQRKLSTSLLQRRLRIGYPRAARLMDELEEQGIVGPSDGSKSRDVIID